VSAVNSTEESTMADWEGCVDVGDLGWVRWLRLWGLGIAFCACRVETAESQLDRSRGCVSVELALKPQYDFSRKKNGFCRTPNSSGSTESRYLSLETLESRVPS
jgi:hypothetical protein